MTIYILDKDPIKCAQYLDDNSLDKMIKKIARALCNVHHILNERKELEIDHEKLLSIPLSYTKYKSFESNAQWIEWSRKCKANYLKLVELGSFCCAEINYRFTSFSIHSQQTFFWIHKMEKIIEWADNNVPDLKYDSGYFGRNKIVFPIGMPKKYIADIDIIQSYRNFYQSKLKQRAIKYQKSPIHTKSDIKWTRCKKPSWINLEHK